MTPMDHYCRTCRYALDRMETDGSQTFEHPPAVERYIMDQPHQPDPVPFAELMVANMLCDFCSSRAVKWAHRFAQVSSVVQVSPERTTVANLGEWWACCTACDIDVRAGDLESLCRRARRQFASEGGRFARDAVEKQLRPVYTELLITTGGSRQRIPALPAPTPV